MRFQKDKKKWRKRNKKPKTPKLFRFDIDISKLIDSKRDREIIEKFNSLKDKYNSDGTLIEFDKLIELREHNISNILSDSRYTEENKDEMVIGVRESFAGIMYEKLVNDHSEVEVLDLRKRLGDDKFIEELNTII